MRPVFPLHRDEGERIAQDEQVRQEVSDEAKPDQQRWDDQLPEAAQRAPRRQQLDHEEGEERQPGEPRGRGQAAQQPRPEPPLVAGREYRGEGAGAEEGLGVPHE